MVSPKPVKVIAVTSGKGGVGKTNVSVNMSIALSRLGKQVLLMDADLGLANVDVMLGLKPQYNLLHVLNGERDLQEVMVDGPDGLKIIPAASGIKKMAELTAAENAGLIQAFSTISDDIDILVVDTAAGIHDSVVSFCRAARDVLVVVCDEPASITDAYALIKVLNTEYQVQRFHILSNMTHEQNEGIHLFKKLTNVTDRFLDVSLNYLGAVPYDEHVRKALQKQQAVVKAYERCKAAQAYNQIAQKVTGWPEPRSAHGHMEFFVERLVQFSAAG